MLDILESKGNVSLEDEKKLALLSQDELIQVIRSLMTDSYDLLSAMEYLHAQDLSNLETTLLEKFQTLESSSQTSFRRFENDLQDQEDSLIRLNQKLNSTTDMLESIE